MRYGSKRFIVCMFATLCLMGILSQSAFGQGISDNFNQDSLGNDILNTILWSPNQSGGPTVSQGNCRVNVFLPSTSVGDPFWAGYTSKLAIEGDLDIQVDYKLHVWPTGNGVRLGLSVVPTDGVSYGYAVERSSLGNNDVDPNLREVYLAHYPPDAPQGLTATTDRKGTLRLTRVGSTWTSYYWNPATNQWVLIYSAPGFEGPGYFGFSAWSHDLYFTQRQVRVSFNNFRINSGFVNCPIMPIGLEAPLGELVHAGDAAPAPNTTFNRGQTLPLKLRQTFNGGALTAPSVYAPEIVELSRNGQSIDISTLHLDARAPKSKNLRFAGVGKKWVFQLRSTQLLAGNYIVTLELSDGSRWDASFVLK